MSESRGLVCRNGHAMDEGYSECPCCGAYRRPRSLKPGITQSEQMAAQAYDAVHDFVVDGAWPAPGVLPPKVSFRRGLRRT